MSGASNGGEGRSTPKSPVAKAAYRREEKRLLLELAKAAEDLAQPRLNYAELYIGRLLVATAIRDLIVHTGGVL